MNNYDTMYFMVITVSGENLKMPIPTGNYSKKRSRTDNASSSITSGSQFDKNQTSEEF